MTKKSRNSSKGWSKGKPVTQKMVNGLSKGLDRASRNAKTGKFAYSDIIVRGEGKSYKFRELG